MNKSFIKPKSGQRKKLHFEAIHAQRNEPNLWEDINDYLESIGFFGYNEEEVIT